jgi:8-amino-7-oxononanoate synthase
MPSLNYFLNEKLSTRSSNGNLRALSTATNGGDFFSNDYLGLARSEELYNRISERYSSLAKTNGSTGSRLLSGNTSYTESVESKLAQIFQAEAVLIFNSGYAANQAVLSSIPQRGDTIIYDELAHACIKDGARLSLATRHSFRHNDVEDLEKKIIRSSGRIFIAVESIYSMDGDACPMQQLVVLAEKYGAFICLDEAHSTGIAGDAGSGLACATGLHSQIPIRVFTFGKALGVHGACVAGDRALIQYLLNFARPFIFTTALPTHSIASIACAFDYLGDNISLQTTLQSKVDLFLRHAGYSNRVQSNSAIQTAILPGNTAVKRVARTLQQKGFDVRAILSPTVAANTERLRICLHTHNTDEDITALASELTAIGKTVEMKHSS